MDCMMYFNHSLQLCVHNNVQATYTTVCCSSMSCSNYHK